KAGDYAQARHFNSLRYSGHMPDGTLWTSSGTLDPWNTANNTPLSIADRVDDSRIRYRLLGSMDLNYEIIKNLIFKTSVGGYYNIDQHQVFTQSDARQDRSEERRVGKETSWGGVTVERRQMRSTTAPV